MLFRSLSNRQATTMKALPGLCRFLIKEEPMTGFEPVTSSLPRKCSTTELHWQNHLKSTSVQSRSSRLRAEDEAQTRDPQLGRLMLYQLSYFRIRTLANETQGLKTLKDFFVGADGFEPPKA